MLTQQDLDHMIELCRAVPAGQRGQMLRKIAVRTQQDRSHEEFVFRLHGCPVEYKPTHSGPQNVRYPKLRGPTLLHRIPLAFLTPALMYLWERPLASFTDPCHMFLTGRQYFRLTVPVRAAVPLPAQLPYDEAAVTTAMDEISELMTIRTAVFLACLKKQDAVAMADDPSPFLVSNGCRLPASANPCFWCHAGKCTQTCLSVKRGTDAYSPSLLPSAQLDTETTASLRVLPLGR